MIVPLRYLAAAERARSPTPSAITSYLARYAPAPARDLRARVRDLADHRRAQLPLTARARTAAAITAATGGGLRVAAPAARDARHARASPPTFILISLRSMRVGLLTRLMGGVGIISGVLFLIPLTPLPVVQALWLVFFGAMLLQFGGRPLPEAWTVARGAAVAERRRARERQRASRARRARRAARRRRRRPSRSSSAARRRRRRRSASAAAERRPSVPLAGVPQRNTAVALAVSTRRGERRLAKSA